MPDMRFAPPPSVRVADRGGGLNQTSVRTFNERLVVSLIGQHERLSRMELGQLSGLSAQTISVIVRGLERDSLILRGEAQRGRVGPPTIPMSLNPEGAFALGIKIGIKSTDIVLIDFTGHIRQHNAIYYNHPEPEALVTDIESKLSAIIASVPANLRERIVGLGISLPDEADSWPLPEWELQAPWIWAEIDFEARLGGALSLPAYIQNDVTAAAGAEVTFGAARTLGDFVYFFVGAHVVNRLILDHRIYAGRKKKTGAGEIPVAALTDLEKALVAAKADDIDVWTLREKWSGFGKPGAEWENACAEGLASAILSASAFVDLDTAIIDGRFPSDVRARISAGVTERLSQDAAGSGAGITVIEGTVGPLAKAVGAANLPIQARFMVAEIGLAGT